MENIEYTKSDRLEKTMGLLKKSTELRDLLMAQVELSNEEIKVTTPIFANELRIKIIRMEAEIHQLNRLIKEKGDYYKFKCDEFVSEVTEMNLNYDFVMKRALILKATDIGVKKRLDNTNWEAVKNNLDIKLEFYKSLRNLIGKR